MNIQAHRKMTTIIALVLISSCSGYNKTKIANVTVSFPGSNVLNAQIEARTTDAQDAFIQYRVAGTEEKPKISQTSGHDKNHTFFLSNLKPGQQYVFNIITSKENSTQISRDYFFKTIDYRQAAQDMFQVTCTDTSALPDVFKKGYVMVHQREVPGIIALLNSKGNIVWHYQSKNAGFKVVHFTTKQTLLCLLGTKEYATSYGSAILELSLTGDTLLYLKKGQNDFQQTIHHEIITNSKNQIVTLCVVDKIIDLRSRGGLEKDTVRGDGILVLDRQGRKKWMWTVFAELDPLQDERILQTKRDWMHANSVSFDKDGNYLVSFYNNGQVWKIDAVTGKVLWKFGKDGDFEMPPGVSFDQAHAVHINDRGWLQFFDNGTKNKISGTLAFTLDEKTKKAQLMINTLLPPQLFSNRMGSSYLISDNNLLQCASQQKTLALTNFNGDFLWQLRTSGIISYRAQFISKENVEPFLIL